MNKEYFYHYQGRQVIQIFDESGNPVDNPLVMRVVQRDLETNLKDEYIYGITA
jgi:hypothetical protein